MNDSAKSRLISSMIKQRNKISINWIELYESKNGWLCYLFEDAIVVT